MVVLDGFGQLEGQAVDGVARFLNVPFAAPPVGPLRWRPPQPPNPLAAGSIHKNPKELSRNPQPGRVPELVGDFANHTLHDSEDSLVLNVFTPEGAVVAGGGGGSGSGEGWKGERRETSCHERSS